MSDEKTVWIACRVKRLDGKECPGRQAVITGSRPVQAGQGLGGFEPSHGGSFTRYRCTTCQGTFAIST